MAVRYLDAGDHHFTAPLEKQHNRRNTVSDKDFGLTRTHSQTAIPQVLVRKSSFGHTQYIPPGMRADLITLVATMGVSHSGHSLAVLGPLPFPRLARAVLLSFPLAIYRRLLHKFSSKDNQNTMITEDRPARQIVFSAMTGRGLSA